MDKLAKEIFDMGVNLNKMMAEALDINKYRPPMSEDEYMERRRLMRNCEVDEWGHPMPPWGSDR